MLRRSSYIAALAGVLQLVCIATSSWAQPVDSAEKWWKTTTSSGIGVNYGMVADNLPSPQDVVKLVQTTYIDKIKLYASDPEVLQAFAHTGIGLVAGVANEDIPTLSMSARAARAWVQANLAPYYPATSILALAVGNEILTSKNQALINQLVPAMKNLHYALASLRMQDIKVSTTHSMAVLATSYPPSVSTFQPDILPVMKSLLAFLSQTGSSFMSNAYPYFAYKQNADVISLDYALFRPNPGVTDPNTGLHYSNLFDAQVDSIFYAMKASGYGDVPVIVAETGWPSAGDPDEIGAGMQNAQEYNANLIKHINSNAGTPYKPRTMLDIYIFALFNEDQKPGPTSERNFGLFHPDKSSVYDVGLIKTSYEEPSSTDSPPSYSTPVYTPTSSNPSSPKSPTTVPTYTPPPSIPSSPKSPTTVPTSPVSGRPAASTAFWCVASPTETDAVLQKSMDFACGEGGADCKAIQAGGACFNPNTVVSHASYAMNSYYQRHGRNYWNCYFNGAGLLTPTDPSYGSCTYPSQ